MDATIKLGLESNMPIGDDGEFVDAWTFARYLRNNPTPAERALWDELRSRKTGYKFRRQMRIDERTYVDLCCPSVKVIVELDGESHEGREESDAARDERLRGHGFLVLRFRNEEVLQHTARVVGAIFHACEGRDRRRY